MPLTPWLKTTRASVRSMARELLEHPQVVGVPQAQARRYASGTCIPRSPRLPKSRMMYGGMQRRSSMSRELMRSAAYPRSQPISSSARRRLTSAPRSK